MGKKKRLNRLITKWIKSDLPEDHSTVLLLGVTRIPTSPTPARRPCSLPLSAQPAFLPSPKTNPIPAQHHGDRPVKKKERSQEECDKSALIPEGCASSSSTHTTPSVCVSHDSSRAPMMDRSVDSIGTCSLDVDASVDSSEWSEPSSAGTLRSGHIATDKPEAKLPSYLSLACTVNGYSTTINYDPERLARSRDSSPHRLHDHDHQPVAYSIHNNLLSPPNLVPLPTQSFQPAPRSPHAMADNTITTHHRQEFYTSSKTMNYITKESRNFTSSMFGVDAVDACLDNNRKNLIHNKCVSYESKTLNGESSMRDFGNGDESKSFIEQRIERLYGPGALAHGFFVMKRQKNRSFEMEKEPKSTEYDNHSKSMFETIHDEEEVIESSLKQSTSSPTLPVMRHLRPEFRAQLPPMSQRKGSETAMSKSTTIPSLKEEVKLNGHSTENEELNLQMNGNADLPKIIEPRDKSDEKNGHYFIDILEKENKRLLILADQGEAELNAPDLPEEAKGILRSAAGKARLLVFQKMQQFKGLCTKNITQVEGEKFPTTNDDLQGFWDMVMLQVQQIDALFKDIEILKANNWTEKVQDEVDKVKMNVNGSTVKIKKVIRSKPNASTEEARKQREAQRKQIIEERRKAMRELKQQTAQQHIEIFVPESS